MKIWITIFANLLVAAQAVFNTHIRLPTIDLGYQVHRAISFNVWEKTQMYNFTNIPYAEPPLGKLRFAAPVPPKGYKSRVQDGSVGKICPQAYPDWLAVSMLFAPAWAAGQPFNFTQAVETVKRLPPQPIDHRMTEDCLVLDVLVPKRVFEARNTQVAHSPKGAPVIAWIHGGGYVFGEKGMFGSPDDLLAATQRGGADGAIFVALNYRLGAFGFLSGPTLQTNGSANAGLLDQRLALQWIQQNIHKFGGNKDEVTIMGVSSGGGSVMHQLTAYGGLKPVAFQRAIPQSSGFVPTPGTQIQEETYAKFLSNLNVSSIEAARTLPSNELLVANAKQVGDSFWGTFTFGPVVDNDFVPGPAAKLLMQGSYAKHVAILSSHTANEGLVFTDPRSAGNNTHLRIQLRDILPTISEENQDFVLEKLYPPVYNGSKPWKDPIGRVMTLIGELALTCNTNAMAKYAQLHGTPAFHFDFSVPPALHGDDQPYTFARGSVPGMDPEIASIIQNAIAGFVMRGIPARSPITKASVVPAYGSENKVLNLAVHDTAAVKDPESNERCEWWHKALYY